MITPQHNLLGLTQKELIDFVLSLGESSYRGGQMFRWLYARGATDIQSMTDLGKSFRERLDKVATVHGLRLVKQMKSPQDGTTKFLFGLHDDLKIETVLIPPSSAFQNEEAAMEDEQKRLTVCISTQVGCPLDCKFCATASMGSKRNLSVGEIVDQILQVKRLTGKRITNIVFMGMGEPMLNYDNVIKSVEIITAGMGLAARRITISTAGCAEKIRQLGDQKWRTKLAVSLHSAVDETRTKLMPINKKYNLRALISAVEYYYSKTKQRVTYEHIFFDGVNDTEKEIQYLVKLARRVPCKINVIPYHSIAFTAPAGLAASLRPSPRMGEIVERLRASNLNVFVRSSAGADIKAACGQLAVHMERHRKRQPSISNLASTEIGIAG